MSALRGIAPYLFYAIVPDVLLIPAFHGPNRVSLRPCQPMLAVRPRYVVLTKFEEYRSLLRNAKCLMREGSRFFFFITC